MIEVSSVELEINATVHKSPELRLWCAVLFLAILDAEPWINESEEKSYDQYQNGKKALNWLLSESNHQGSFRWICDLTGLEASRVRTLIGIAGKKNIW